MAGTDGTIDAEVELRAQLQESQRLTWQTNDALRQARSDQEAALRRAVAAEERAKGLQADALRAAAMDRRCADLQRQLVAAQLANSDLTSKEVDARQQLSQTHSQLLLTKEACQRAVQAAAHSDAERSRLQRARDESVVALRAAEARAQQAEEETDRAEEIAASARAELLSAPDWPEREGEGEGRARSFPDGGEAPSGDSQDWDRLALSEQLQQERQSMAALLSQAAAEKQQTSAAYEAEVQALRSQISHLEGGHTIAVQPANSPISEPKPAANAGGNEVMSTVAEDTAAEGADEEVMATLRVTRRRCTQLKVARDRLLLEVDALSIQAERLAAENTALSEALAAAQASESGWQQRAQNGLAHSEHLTNLLSESAAWPSHTAATRQKEGHQQPGGSTSPVEDAHQALLIEQARAAQLQLQVNALVMELARCDEMTAALGRATLPALGQVEEQLAAALRMGMA